MTSQQAPLWAISAEAIDGAGDTHLPPGIHVRALPAPRLGLPATPLVVTRLVVDPAGIKRLGRTDGVTWIDSQGTTLTVPFEVTPNNPVFGHFSAPNVIWAELDAKPAEAGTGSPVLPVGDLADLLENPIRPLTPPVIPVTPVTPGRRPGLAAAAPAAARPATAAARPAAAIARANRITAFRNPEQLTRFADRLRDLLAAAAAKPGSIRFEALASTPLGVAAIQSRNEAPYALANFTIPLVRVVGRGTVRGIRWLDASQVDVVAGRYQDFAIWSLPVDPAPRYNPTANAAAEAKDRVQRAGATRTPMHVAYTATSPATAPVATGGDAQARVEQVRGEVDTWLKTILNDLTAETFELTDTQPIDGNATSSISIPMEPFVIAGAIDPDVGHYLGLGDADQSKPLPAKGSLVIYRVRGLWRYREKRWAFAETLSFLPAVRATLGDALDSFPEMKPLDILPSEEGPFLDLHATAVALVGSPPSLPPQPSMNAPIDRGWLATPPPPNVRRALRLLANGFRPHALAALAATDANGDRSLHAFPKQGRALPGQPLPEGMPLPLVVSRPVDAAAPGEARFEDRDAPEGPVHYRLAQGDWFGRWSTWAFRSAAAKARTAPHAPAIELSTQPPAFGNPIPDGLLHGTIELRIPIPRTPDLPAGGSALTRLELRETFEGSPITTLNFTLANPAPATISPQTAPAHNILVIKRNGPDLPRSGSRKVSYTARWVDALNLVSPDSEPAARTIVDPRPPPAPPVVTELRWTARPDSMGHARVDLDFGSTVGTRYRVFATHETILLRALELSGQNAARGDILSAEPGAPRAARFKAHKALFDWPHFECVTEQPILATAGTTHFTHRVSGSLEVLAIYRVLAEGASGALSEMTEAEIVPFAVPNLGAPSRPAATVLNTGLDPMTNGVQLRVKVPRGKAAPVAWRLRRASAPVSDPLGMRIVAEGVVAGATVDTEGTSFEIADAAALLPWRQYRFSVEVQAGPPPGAPSVGVILPGEWSEASVPATLAVIPPAPPAAPSAVTIANVAGGLHITVAHPAAATLIGTALGPHHFDVWRVEPGNRSVKPEPAFVLSGSTWVADDAGAAVPGSYVTVRIIDPAGRASDATISNQIP